MHGASGKNMDRKTALKSYENAQENLIFLVWLLTQL